jgi:hypothetical protein
MAKTNNQGKRPPEKSVGPFTGGIGVAVWVNTVETQRGDRQMRSITINPRRYFDEKSEQWKDAASFRVRDIPELIFALQQAYAHCLTEPLDQDDHPRDDEDQNVPY